MTPTTKYKKRLSALIDPENAAQKELFDILCDQLGAYELCKLELAKGILIETERGGIKINPALQAQKIIAELVLKYLRALDVKTTVSSANAVGTLDKLLELPK